MWHAKSVPRSFRCNGCRHCVDVSSILAHCVRSCSWVRRNTLGEAAHVLRQLVHWRVHYGHSHASRHRLSVVVRLCNDWLSVALRTLGRYELLARGVVLVWHRVLHDGLLLILWIVVLLLLIRHVVGLLVTRLHHHGLAWLLDHHDRLLDYDCVCSLGYMRVSHRFLRLKPSLLIASFAGA